MFRKNDAQQISMSDSCWSRFRERLKVASSNLIAFFGHCRRRGGSFSGSVLNNKGAEVTVTKVGCRKQIILE